MEIINAHAHIYPEKIAPKATDAIGKFYDINMKVHVGTTKALVDIEEKAGVSRFIVHSVATKKEQVSHINAFIYGELQKYSEFIGFMTLHPDMTKEEMVQEISLCKERGFKGIKLHPDFQKFNIDSIEADNIYKAILETNCNFPILFHMGDNRYDYSAPKRLSIVAKKYPNINFIAAHFGGYRCWDDIDVYTGLNNVYFDTSSSLSYISKEKALSIIKKFGVERFFFGDDFPMWNINDELSKFLSLGLTDEENELIFAKNIKKLLNI